MSYRQVLRFQSFCRVLDAKSAMNAGSMTSVGTVVVPRTFVQRVGNGRVVQQADGRQIRLNDRQIL